MFNKNVFDKTRKKLILYNLLAVQVFMLVFSIFIYTYFSNVTYRGIDRDIRSEFSNVINQFQSERSITVISLMNPKDMVYIYKDGKIQYYTENRYMNKAVPGISKNLNGGFMTYSINGFTFREMNVESGSYHVQIIRNIDSEMNALKHILFTLITFGLFSLFVSYIIAILLMKNAFKSIKSTWDNQVNFIQDASHELRTPVSIVQSKLEGLLKTPQSTVNDRIDDIAVAMQETRRLNKMIRDLLSLTKEDNITKFNITEFDPEDLIDEVYRNYTEFAEYQEKSFSYSADYKKKKPELLTTDRGKLRQVLIILLDNAFKYTEEGDSISMELAKYNKEHFRISVIDTGIGMDEKDIPLVFDRFYRSDSVRAQDIEGSGIGLSIAKMVMTNLGGEIKVSSKKGEGTRFDLKVPKNYF